MIIAKRNRSNILCYWDDALNASKVKSPKETLEQKQLKSHCEIKWPKEYAMMFHIINESGASGDGHYGGILNALGRKKGVSDWLVLVPNGYGKPYMVLELKRSRKEDSGIKKEQKEFLLNAESFNGHAVVAYGFKAALKAIKDYFDNKLNKLN